MCFLYISAVFIFEQCWSIEFIQCDQVSAFTFQTALNGLYFTPAELNSVIDFSPGERLELSVFLNNLFHYLMSFNLIGQYL